MAAMAAKRKREAGDMPSLRQAPGISHDFEPRYLAEDDHIDQAESGLDFSSTINEHDPASEHVQPARAHAPDVKPPSTTDTAAAAIAQYHTMTVPQTTEQAFMQQHPAEVSADRPQSTSGDQSNAQRRASSFGEYDMGPPQDRPNESSAPNGETSPSLGPHSVTPITPKPQVGSEEWHKVRKDNHKEVERRRRETINEGINELAKIVPGCEKNKGSILARAVQFITQLKENETQNIEKWTLEKLLTEQAIAELSSSCDKLKAECQRAWAECEQWKKAAQKAGVTAVDAKEDVEGEEAG